MSYTPLLETASCYHASNLAVREESATGKYFDLRKLGFSNDDISWDDHLWQTDKQHFYDFLQAEIEHYEKVHRTQVYHICLAGKVGRWNGNFVGGRALNYNDNPLECLGDVTDIDVDVMHNDRRIRITGYHHDGSHAMNIYIIPDSLHTRWDNKGYYDTPEFYAWLVENRKPLRLRKANTFYKVEVPTNE